MRKPSKSKSRRYQIPIETILVAIFVIALGLTALVAPTVKQWSEQTVDQSVSMHTAAIVSYPDYSVLRGEGDWSEAFARTFFFNSCLTTCQR